MAALRPPPARPGLCSLRAGATGAVRTEERAVPVLCGLVAGLTARSGPGAGGPRTQGAVDRGRWAGGDAPYGRTGGDPYGPTGGAAGGNCLTRPGRPASYRPARGSGPGRTGTEAGWGPGGPAVLGAMLPAAAPPPPMPVPPVLPPPASVIPPPATCRRRQRGAGAATRGVRRPRAPGRRPGAAPQHDWVD